MVSAVSASVALLGCGPSVPPTAGAIIDSLEDAGLASCSERREPIPDVVTCEDGEAGDLTVGIVDDGLSTVRATAGTAAGPWIVGESFVVITYDDDVDRASAIVEVIGAGELYTTDDAGDPQPLRS